MDALMQLALGQVELALLPALPSSVFKSRTEDVNFSCGTVRQLAADTNSHRFKDEGFVQRVNNL
jgi:hypothetical protein